MNLICPILNASVWIAYGEWVSCATFGSAGGSAMSCIMVQHTPALRMLMAPLTRDKSLLRDRGIHVETRLDSMTCSLVLVLGPPLVSPLCSVCVEFGHVPN